MANLKCRICIEEAANNNTLHLFTEEEEHEGKLQMIPDIIEMHLGFKLSRDDAFSSVVCLTCWNLIKEFHDFYLRINEAQRLYNSEVSLISGKHAFSTALPEEEILMEQIKIEPDLDAMESNPQYSREARDVSNPLSLATLPTTSYHQELLSENEEDYDLMEADIDVDADEDDDSMVNNGVKVEEDADADYVDDDNSDNDATPRKGKSTASLKKNVKIKMKVAATKKTKKSGKDPAIRPAKRQRVKKKVAEKSQATLKAGQRNIYLPTDDDLIRKYIPFNCGECGHNVQDLDELKKHFGEEHGDKQPFIRCCGRKFVKRPYLIQHAYKHLDPERYKCPDCQKTYTDDYALRTHIIAQHPKEEDLKFSCDQCEKRFARKYLLEFHKGSHIPVEERKFKCEICEKPKVFSSNHLLKSHIAMIHKRDKRICHYCGKEMKDKDTFERHIRSHTNTNAPRLKCPKEGCTSWLKDADNLKKHMRRHTQEGEVFECPQCGKKCSNREALRSHIHYKHSGHIFTCEYCQKDFKRAITLKEHMAQHTGETLYKCPFCERTFNSNANMHSHKKKMHPAEYSLLQQARIAGTAEKFLSDSQTITTKPEETPTICIDLSTTDSIGQASLQYFIDTKLNNKF